MKQIKNNIFSIFAFVMLFTLTFSSLVGVSHSATNDVELYLGINSNNGLSPRVGVEVQVWELKGKSYSSESEWKSYLDPKSDMEIEKEFGKPVLTQKSNSDGIIRLTGLNSGTYYLRDKNSSSDMKTIPTVLILPSYTNRINIKSTTPDRPTPYKPNKGMRKFKKIDGEKFDPLSGAKFKLTKKNNKGEYDSVLTNDGKPYMVESGKDGYFTVSDLEYGTYYLWEVNAPEGYEKLKTPIEFTINSDISTSVDNEIVIKNNKTTEKPKGSKVFKKVDGENLNFLQGAKFKVTKKSDKGDYEAVLDESGKQYFVESGSDGYFKVENLEYGKYYLWEVSSPIGYEKLSVPIEFSIDKQDNEGDVDKVVMVKNNKIPLKPPIQIPKTGDLIFFVLVIGGLILFAIGYRMVREKE